jgi:septal ring-binding cell division protein DamX
VATPTASASASPDRPTTPATTPPPGASPAAQLTAAPPPSPRATPVPAATASPRPAATADAHSLLRNGSYPEAAQEFASGLKKSGARFSIQILLACSTETIQKANQSVPGDELYILPVTFKGRSCYRICWGLYQTEEAAAAALRALPEYFRRGGATPKVVPTAGMLN